MAKLHAFTVMEMGATPEEAFERAKAKGFGENIHGKDYMVFIATPKRRRPITYMYELLDTDIFLRDSNGPVGCLLAHPAGWVDECSMFSRVEPQKEYVYLARDTSGNELFSLPDKNQASKKARRWSSENGINVSVFEQVRLTKKTLEYRPLPEHGLNAYWFFGWALV